MIEVQLATSSGLMILRDKRALVAPFVFGISDSFSKITCRFCVGFILILV
jgi:hypothetical protein